MVNKFLLIENNNFINFPTGGTLSFDKHLLKVIPANRISLVGITIDNQKIGQWTSINIEGKEYDFFPILKIKDLSKKPLIPSRLTSVFALIFYLKKIRKNDHSLVFTQTPQFLFALRFYNWQSLCFCFAGVSNSVSLSRYAFLRFLGAIYEKLLFITLEKKVSVILAAADIKAIEELKVRSKGLLKSRSIIPFPTRFDNTIFKPLNIVCCRANLGLPSDRKILVSVGRLSWVKGWDLLIEMMKISYDKNYLLIFVGDGEDRTLLENTAHDLIESNKVIITGVLTQKEVAEYINASDVILVGSYHEGWSTSMVESIACGKPIVATNVSGASELISNGGNGFIMHNRDPEELVRLIENTLLLKDSKRVSLELAAKYSLEYLYSDLLNVWPAIK